MKLFIGNKNYSSWSLRPWLTMKMAGIVFDEERICLDQPDTREKILAVSPTGRVPVLVDRKTTVWDSLAICEYIAETFAGSKLWPSDRATRARARAVTAEMHSGFMALRSAMPMNIRARLPEKGAAAMAKPEVMADIERIQAIWTESLARSAELDRLGDTFLFGRFSIADAFYAPVVTRFITYGVPLSDELAAYSQRVLELPPMQEWMAAAEAEAEDLGDH
ncbi:MAG: glutathione S-transferase family protein [Burkholderiaceae bacterium]